MSFIHSTAQPMTVDKDPSLKLKHVRSHLADLPRTDPERAIAAITSLVRQIDFKSVSAPEALNMLELSATAAMAFEHQWINHQTLSGHGGLRSCTPGANAVYKLHHLLANQLQALAQSTVIDKKHGFDKRQLAKAITLTMLLLTDSQRNAYCIYNNESKDDWKRLHTLYSMAEAKDLLQSRFKFDHIAGELSADRIYKRHLLLAIAKPYQLPAGEIFRLASLFDQLAETVELRTGVPQNKAMYFVDLGSGNPPRFGRISKPGEYRSVRTIELDKALEHFRSFGSKLMPKRQAQVIEHHLGGIETSQAQRDSALEKELLQIERNLAGWTKRRFGRAELDTRLEYSLGVAATHNALTHNRPFEPEKELSRIAQKQGSLKVANFALLPTSNHANSTDSEDEEINLDDQVSRSGLATPSAFKFGSARLKNWSKGGLRVVQDDRDHTWSVGDLLAFRLKGEASAQWALGCTRWKRVSDSQTELGIVYLGQRIVPVGCRKGGIEDTTPLFRSLLLPGKEPTLVTSSNVFKTDDHLLLVGNGDTMQVTLGEVVRGGPGFTQFQINTPAP
jgi:hypothetical protein